jgi:hypothetical protein
MLGMRSSGFGLTHSASSIHSDVRLKPDPDEQLMGTFFGFGLVLALATASGTEGQAQNTAALQPDAEWKNLGRSLWFDPKAKQAIVRARVVLREGYLEHLLCLKGTKEHEAILATDAVPELIHGALLATGAQAGHPVRFQPKFEKPAGDPIAIELRWKHDGKSLSADAREWVKDEKANAALTLDWVFAGSLRYEDPQTKKVMYAADVGDLFTVANFGNAILDLPMKSAADDADRIFVTNTDKIPPLGTEVFMVLSPRRAKSDQKPAAGATPTR